MNTLNFNPATFLLFFTLLLFTFFNPTLHAGTVYRVKADVAGGNNDGSTWEDAFSDLQNALTIAQSGDEIWVAKGTYFPTSDGNRSTYFRLLKGVKWYGGFEGFETSISERDIQTNETILSGDIGISGDSTDNSYTVVFTIFSDSTTVLDGFIIEKGNADNPDTDLPFYHREKCGGGLYIHGQGNGKSAEPVIRNCVFRSHFAIGNGGAVFANGRNNGMANPFIANCSFIENNAANGGGFYKDGGNPNGIPFRIKTSSFLKNTGLTNGGGMFIDEVSGSETQYFIDSCEFSLNNSGFGSGIGYYSVNDNTLIHITNSNFTKNGLTFSGAQGVGIQIFFDSGSDNKVEVSNCNFSENKPQISFNYALGVFGNLENTLSVRDCNFNLNNIGLYGEGLKVSVDGCTFSENRTGAYIEGHLRLLNSSFFYNSYQAAFVRSFSGENFEISNTIFAFNGSLNETARGGALDFWGGDFEINNSVFFKSKAKYGAVIGNTLTVSSISTFNFTNCIFSENESLNNQSDLGYVRNGQLNFKNCLFDQKNCDSLNVYPWAGYYPAQCFGGNLFNENPDFLDTAALDFRLQPCSPAINAGDNSIINDLDIMYDIAGNPRILDNVPDIGPYENELPTDQMQIETQIKPACWGNDDGNVLFDISGACEPILINGIEWNSNQILIENLASGIHNFNIEDAIGQTDTFSVSINQTPEPVSVSIEHSDVDCSNGETGFAAAVPENAVYPFTFLWSNGATDSLLQNLPSGNFEVTITDAIGCESINSVEIILEENLPLGINVTPIACHDSNDGIAAVTPVIGHPPYQFEWASGETDSLITNLSGGNYSVTVTDQIGCTDELSFIMNAPDSLVLNFETTDISCFGENDGIAIVNPTGGTSPYYFDWDNLSQNDTISNLSLGEYSVTVTDENECQTEGIISISEPEELGIEDLFLSNIYCHGDSMGIFHFEILGGTSPYDFIWSNGDISNPNTHLPAGIHQISVMDANGCPFEHTVEITEPDEILIDSFEIINTSSPTATDGQITVETVLGGTPPFNFSWSTGETTSLIQNLAHGGYSLTILDSMGCFFEQTFTVDFTSNILNRNNDFEIVLSPNPIEKGGVVRISILKDFSKSWEVSILDSAGKMISKTKKNNSVFDIKAPVESGVFWILIENSKHERGHLKLVVY